MSLSWVPNAISVFRIALIPPVIYCIGAGRHAEALILFAVAGFSDGLDGFLAKRYGWHTRAGELLDPIADKFLIVSTYLMLALTGQTPMWLAAVVVGRDLVIIGGATAYHFLVGPVPGEPTLVSKLNTGLELLFVVGVLARIAFGWPEGETVLILGAAVLVTAVVSGLDYVLAWSRRARGVGQERHEA